MNKLIIISGMSGVGKDTVVKILLDNNPHLEKVKTCTTRERRLEDDGKFDDSYDYVSEKEFQKRIKEDYFLEWAHVHRYYYGSPKTEVERIQKMGKVPILVIDVQGLTSVRKIMPKNVISFFINYEVGVTLRDRLIKTRPDITEDEIKSREKSAQREAKEIVNYDYVIINPEGNPEKAANEINSMIGNRI